MNNGFKIKDVRNVVFAGAFYPADPDELRKDVLNYIESCEVKVAGKPRIIIVPHAGYMYSGAVAGCVYKQTKGYKYNNIFILGATHREYVKNIGLGTCPIWRTPLGDLKTNEVLVKKLLSNGYFSNTESAFEEEHSVEVQLPFIKIIHPDASIIPMLSSEILYVPEVIEVLAENIKEDDLLVVSTDLSHYLSAELAGKVDSKTINKILSKKSDFDEGGACGIAGLSVAVALAKKKNYEPKLVKYAHSGMVTGDNGGVVGYGGIIFN